MVVIQEIMKLQEKHKQMVFVRILPAFVSIDKETAPDVKYRSKQYILMIGFSYADKVSSSGFH